MVHDELSVLTAHGLERRSGAAVIIDVVASVSRIEKDELATVIGWVDLLKQITDDILPGHHGRLVKSLGDGALIEFTTPPDAVRAALAIQKLSDLPLRIGIEAGEFLSDVHDIYGRAVNRAARLMSLSEAGCITISDSVRGTLAADLDASIEDLGLHHLKNISEPVRAFRVGQPNFSEAKGIDLDGPVLPTLAIIPFAPATAEHEIPGAGDILCDELIRLMSASPHLRIISRLSTTVFRKRQMPVAETARRLNARFLLTGHYRKDGESFRVELDLIDGRTTATLWRGVAEAGVGDIYAGALGLLETIPTSVSRAIISRETRLAKNQALPTLENYSLLLAATGLTNSLSPKDFSLADKIISALEQRVRNNPVILALRAYWFHLRCHQGWSTDALGDTQRARDYCDKALDIDPESSLALSSRGMIATTFERDLQSGAAFLDEAVRVNPNDPLAWLFRAQNQMFNDEGKAAAHSVRRAMLLAPFHPAMFLFDVIAASAAFARGDYVEAEHLARSSLKANRLHASTHRVLAAALWKLGRVTEAQAQARDLLNIEPGLTVYGWLKRSPAAGNRVGREFAHCLTAIGIP